MIASGGWSRAGYSRHVPSPDLQACVSYESLTHTALPEAIDLLVAEPGQFPQDGLCVLA